MIKTIRVSEKGQIAIPQKMRESLDIKKGDELVLIKVGRRIVLAKTQVIKEQIEHELDCFVELSEHKLKK